MNNKYMKKRGKLPVVGLITLIAGILIIIFTITSGSFHSVLELDRVNNAVYVKSLIGQKKIMRLAEVSSFKMKPGYRGEFFIKKGSLCYNLEITKLNGSKEEAFPFCISNPAKMKSLAKKANAFIDKPNGLKFSISIFSSANLIWFIVGAFAAIAGAVEIKRFLKGKAAKQK